MEVEIKYPTRTKLYYMKLKLFAIIFSNTDIISRNDFYHRIFGPFNKNLNLQLITSKVGCIIIDQSSALYRQTWN